MYSEELEARAKTGDIEAQFDLAMAYFNGDGIEQDEEMAVEIFKILAEHDVGEAQYNLGVCYEEGIGVAANPDKALDWYMRAADNGDADGMLEIGFRYYSGKGVEQDYEQAANLFKEAAAQGITQAKHNLGIMYMNGEGVAKNEKKAVDWFTQAAEEGADGAQCELGKYYRRSGNPAEAVKWLTLAAEQDNVLAQLNLGECCQNGEGVETNPRRAAEYYALVIKNGKGDIRTLAQVHLANLYIQGAGVPQDYDKARQLLESASHGSGNTAIGARMKLEKFKKNIFGKWVYKP